MPLFVKLSNIQRETLFKELKKNIKISWDKFYPPYHISRTMFFNYLSGRYNLPQNLFITWCKTSKISFREVIFIEQKRYTFRKIAKVEMNEKLAEILGILNGDGHISKYNYEICVVGNALEKDYCSHIKNLLEATFNLKSTLKKEATTFKLRIYSKELSNLLVNKYRLPIGKKTRRLHIPQEVFNSKTLLMSYIRGLFDTDGSIYIRRGKDLVLNIKSADKIFLGEIKEVLRKQGFHPSLSNKNLNLYRRNEIAEFIKIVKPSNYKHLKKYQNFTNQSASDLTV